MASTGHVYNPDSADAWKEEIKASFLSIRRQTIDQPVCLRVSFFMPAPKSMKINADQNVPHGKKPDLDNLLKAVMDAMSNVGVWEDDALVYAVESSKWYTRKKTGAQIIVEII